MIRTATFINFKALRHVTVELSPLTLIVGPNASGKTSILEGLHHVAALANSTPPDVFSKDDLRGRLHSVGTSEPMVLTVSGGWDGTDGSFCVKVDPAGDKGPEFSYIGTWGGVALPEQRSAWPRDFRDAVGSAAFLYLDPNAIARPSYSDEISLRVGHDGSNVASVLADLAASDPAGFRRLRACLQAVVPCVKELRLRRAKIEKRELRPVDMVDGRYVHEVEMTVVGHRILFDFLTGDSLEAEMASEGTLLTLGLLTIMSVPPRPRLVLVDGLDRALHPKALGELVRQIRAFQKEFQGLQIVGTTHSPYLVDHFDPSEVILTALRDDGSVVAGGLHEHPEFERWKDEMKPGELWSTVGEDWLRDKKGEEGE